jgi:hypothetical protein
MINLQTDDYYSDSASSPNDYGYAYTFILLSKDCPEPIHRPGSIYPEIPGCSIGRYQDYRFPQETICRGYQVG